MRELNQREIKFRAKTYTSDRWAYGQHYVEWDEECNDRHYIVERTGEAEAARHLWVNPRYLGQYTGCKDKKGNEIYEGDIMQHPRYMQSLFGVVEYDSSRACYVLRDEQGYSVGTLEMYVSKGFLVVGNIYDNPELMRIMW